MDKMYFTIDINASKQKVWETLFGEQTYPEWTRPFNPEGGSYVEGNWEKGSKMRFIGPNKEGRKDGMFALIADNRPHEYMSIEHQGEIMDDKEVTDGPNAQMWKGAQENYTLSEKDGVTTVDIELIGNVPDEFKEMSKQMWPAALAKLKKIAER